MNLFKLFRKRDEANNLTNELGRKCIVEVKMTKAQFMLWAMYYYKGYTSYRAIFKYIYRYNLKPLKKIMDAAKKKAENGCLIDNTYVRFYNEEKFYIDIPFDIFSEKKNMRISRRNTKLWNKFNIKRILLKYPKFIKYENELLKENDDAKLISIMEKINE